MTPLSNFYLQIYLHDHLYWSQNYRYEVATKIILWLGGVAATRGTALRGGSVRMVENHYLRGHGQTYQALNSWGFPASLAYLLAFSASPKTKK